MHFLYRNKLLVLGLLIGSLGMAATSSPVSASEEGSSESDSGPKECYPCSAAGDNHAHNPLLCCMANSGCFWTPTSVQSGHTYYHSCDVAHASC
jgi:hypothetical protein